MKELLTHFRRYQRLGFSVREAASIALMLRRGRQALSTGVAK